MTKQFQEVAKLRIEIDRLRDEIEWVSTAFVPPDELKARATKHCQAMAQEFDAASRLMSLAHPHAGSAEMQAMFKLHSSVFIGGGRVEQQGDNTAFVAPTVSSANIDGAGQMLAWLMGDALAQRMCAEIDRLDYRPGPPMVERPARLAEMNAALRKLEQQEEALICGAEDTGIIIPRRLDADPAVILGYDPKGQMAEDRTRVNNPTVTVVQ